ncbi:hypothetical protein [Picosynechococcus sp. PCC 7002]|uniref:hypothetical protein n=1 Tax=Picosynechococcus sp. (strain ATCC 27264 / PCC 7002 / PR-6) TaxID=32049 RepID=UPI00059B715C|nr:hypothetical protein [Picosynechococcus sp. PCC 7002]
MNKIILASLIAGLLMSCGKNSSNTTVELQESESITTADNLKSSEDSNVNYTVIKDSNMGSIKRSVEVMLEEKITEEELQILANSHKR